MQKCITGWQTKLQQADDKWNYYIWQNQNSIYTINITWNNPIQRYFIVWINVQLRLKQFFAEHKNITSCEQALAFSVHLITQVLSNTAKLLEFSNKFQSCVTNSQRRQIVADDLTRLGLKSVLLVLKDISISGASVYREPINIILYIKEQTAPYRQRNTKD